MAEGPKIKEDKTVQGIDGEKRAFLRRFVSPLSSMLTGYQPLPNADVVLKPSAPAERRVIRADDRPGVFALIGPLDGTDGVTFAGAHSFRITVAADAPEDEVRAVAQRVVAEVVSRDRGQLWVVPGGGALAEAKSAVVSTPASAASTQDAAKKAGA